ncbi:MAG: GNAT family N-acetyltransferase [Gammaproteobacteria bacterium]|nr:GNAT family N-acetyltransferase [Gammaproteobacteria bacterium]
MIRQEVILPAAATRLQADGEAPLALVIGMSIQGLAVARALARNGVRVHALEQTRQPPGTRTRYATLHYATGVNSDRLVDILLELRPRLPSTKPVVLFPGSDNMVRAIANGWEQLAPHYALSWHESRELVLYLQNKDHLENLCDEKGIAYPKSVLVSEDADLETVFAKLAFPLLVKPIRPLSGFKAIKIQARHELFELLNQYRADLPYLVQEWIEGDEKQLLFCTMYMDHGRPLCHFTGRKLRSRPRGLGMGTVVESCDDEEALRISRQFVENLPLSGPIAVEFKRDPAGKYWLIEPNVGRTEYSVDLLIQNGINLPLIEYWSAQGFDVDVPPYRRPVVWFDSERDTLAYPQLCLESGSLKPVGKHPVFPYLGHGDAGPFLHSTRNRLLRPVQGVVNRLRRLAGLDLGAILERHARLADLPAEAREFLRARGQQNLFFGESWFENYEREVAVHEGRPEWYCVYNQQRRLLGVWPFVRMPRACGDVLKGMSNYYTPYVTLPHDARNDTDLVMLRSALTSIVRTASYLEMFQVAPDDEFLKLLASRFGPLSTVEMRSKFTVNWFDDVRDVAAYWRRRDPLLVNTLARKTRKLEREARLEVRIESDPDAVERGIADYFKVYDHSWKSREPHPGFIQNLMRYTAREGLLRLGLLYIDGEPAAAQLWFVQNGTASIYKLAYDQKFEHRSAGTLLTARMIDHVTRHDGVTKLDYLTGDDKYKSSWMSNNRPLVTVWLADLTRPCAWYYYARKRLARLWHRLARDGEGDAA